MPTDLGPKHRALTMSVIIACEQLAAAEESLLELARQKAAGQANVTAEDLTDEQTQHVDPSYIGYLVDVVRPAITGALDTPFNGVVPREIVNKMRRT